MNISGSYPLVTVPKVRDGWRHVLGRVQPKEGCGRSSLPLKLPVNTHPPCHSSQEPWYPFPFSPFTQSSHLEQEGLLNSDLLKLLTLSKSGLLFSLQGFCWHLSPCLCKSTYTLFTCCYVSVLFSFSAPLVTLADFPGISRAVPWCSPLVPVFLLFSLLWKHHLSKNTHKLLF